MYLYKTSTVTSYWYGVCYSVLSLTQLVTVTYRFLHMGVMVTAPGNA